MSCQREFEKKITMKNQGSARHNQSETSTDARPTAASLHVGDMVQVKTRSKYQDQQGTVIRKKNKICVQFTDGNRVSFWADSLLLIVTQADEHQKDLKFEWALDILVDRLRTVSASEIIDMVIHHLATNINNKVKVKKGHPHTKGE